MESLTESIIYFCENNPQKKSSNDLLLPGDSNISTLILSFKENSTDTNNNLPKFEDIYNIILPFLNDMNNQITRSNAYTVLLSIIQCELPYESETPSILIKWLQERICNDLICFVHLFSILKILNQKWNITDYEYRLLMQNIFENVPVQQMNVQERRLFFDIMKWLVEEKPKVCQMEFILGYIQVIDGERDPFILNNNFNLFPKLVQIAGNHIDQHAEDIFDIFSCYFPVNFNPPKKDPFGITRDGLASSLLETLASTPAFADYAIPFFQEKIASAIVETKVESLNALSYCIEKYREEAIREHLTDIWATIRTEVLRSVQPEVHRASIETITRIARIVSSPALTKEECLSNLQSVLLPAVQEIRSPECKMARQFSEMIASVASSSEWNCEITTEYIIPQIYDLYMEVKTTPKRSGILTIGMQILSTLIFFPNLTKSRQFASEKMFEIAFSLKEDYNLNKEVTEIMSRLFLLEDYIKYKEPTDFLVKVLLLGNESDKNYALECLEWVCINAKQEEIVKEKILDPLLSSISIESLPNESDQIKKWKEYLQYNNEAFIRSTLDASSRISTISSKLSPLCIEKCFSLLFQEIEEIQLLSIQRDLMLGLIILPILKKCIEKTKLEETKSVFYLESLASYIGNYQLLFNLNVIEDISEISRMIFSNLNIQSQTQLGSLLLQVILSNTQALKYFKIKDQHFDSFSVNDSFLFWASKSLLYLRKEIFANNSINVDFNQLSSKLLQYISNTQNDQYAESVTHFFSSILNKLPLEPIHKILSDLQITLNSKLQENATERIVFLFSWILKGIVMRADCINDTSALNESFQQLLLSTDSTISFAAARGYGVVMRDEVLNKNSYCNETLFYKQRFFLLNINTIVDKYSKVEEKFQGPFLEAVANLIQSIPSKVLTQHINNLYPLVQAALQSTNEDVIQSGLNTLLVLFEDAEDYCKTRLHDTIPILLTLSHSKVKMQARCTALRCLQRLSSYPYENILSFQNDIIRGLRAAIDDHKRIVRKEAVITRNRWYVLNK